MASLCLITGLLLAYCELSDEWVILFYTKMENSNISEKFWVHGLFFKLCRYYNIAR